MGRSFDTENRRLTRRATASVTEWGTPLRGSRAIRTPRNWTPHPSRRPGSRTSGFLGSA